MLMRNLASSGALTQPLKPEPRLPPRDALADMRRLFHRHRRGLLAWTGLCLAAAFVHVTLATPEYVATAQILLDSRPLQQSADAARAAMAAALDNAQIESEVQVSRSEKVLRRVFDTLNLAEDPEFGARPAHGWVSRPDAAEQNRAVAAAFQNFADRLSVRRVGQSLVLEISFRATTPEQAARLANAVAYAAIGRQIEQRQLEARRNGDWLRSTVAALDAQEDAIAEAMRTGAPPRLALTASPAQIISEATIPLGKSYPRKPLILFSALCFAALTGLGAVAARRGLDRRLRGWREIEEHFHLDGLAVLPYDIDVPFRASASLAHYLSRRRDAPFARGVEALTSVLLSQSGPANTVGVVACHRFAGATTIATALAIQIAARGYATALAKFNPRADAMTREDASFRGAKLTASDKAIAAPRLVDFEILTGDGAAGRAETAASADDDARGAFSHVVIDFSATTESVGVLTHANLIDGVIIVVEAEKTTSDQLADVIHSVRLTKTPILGVVVNKARDAG